MADEEKNEKEAVTEKPAKKSNKLLIIILLITGLVIGGGGAAAFLIFKNIKSENREGSGKESKQESMTNPLKLGPVMKLDPFIVNLSGAGGRNYLKMEISLELDNAVVQTEIDNKMPRVKDAILLLLSSKSFEEIQHAEGKLMLKNEMIALLNKILTSGMIKNLYFTNFVVQ